MSVPYSMYDICIMQLYVSWTQSKKREKYKLQAIVDRKHNAVMLYRMNIFLKQLKWSYFGLLKFKAIQQKDEMADLLICWQVGHFFHTLF